MQKNHFFLLLLLSVSICFSASAEETKLPESSFYSQSGKQTLDSMKKIITLDNRILSVISIEQILARDFGFHFSHSHNAKLITGIAVKFPESFKGSISDLFALISSQTPIRSKVNFDGTVLIYHKNENNLISMRSPREDFESKLLPKDATWRMRLAYFLNGRVSLGVENISTPLGKQRWRFRYCPILSPFKSLDNVFINRLYLYEPLGKILDEVCEKNNLRYFPWGGVLLVVPKGTPPGKTPDLPHEECWAGTGESKQIFSMLAQEIDTEISAPSRASMIDFGKLKSKLPFKLVVTDDAAREQYKGFPCGRIKLKYFLGLLKKIDGIDVKIGKNWVLLHVSPPEKKLIDKLNFKPEKIIVTGDPLPEGKIIETKPFQELTDEEIEVLRKMPVCDRFARKITINFDNMPLSEALRKLEYVAFFHFTWDDRTKKHIEKYSVNSFFDSFPAGEIIKSISFRAELEWRMIGEKPDFDDHDFRFLIKLSISTGNSLE